jgi:hypothetical protein
MRWSFASVCVANMIIASWSEAHGLPSLGLKEASLEVGKLHARAIARRAQNKSILQSLAALVLQQRFVLDGLLRLT